MEEMKGTYMNVDFKYDIKTKVHLMKFHNVDIEEEIKN